jgi:hypothetical protein
MNGALADAAATLRRSGAQLRFTADELAQAGGEPGAPGIGEPGIGEPDARGPGELARLGAAEAFGAGGPGRLGELGADLHHCWQNAITARAREARAQADRLSETGDRVERARRAYAEADRPRPAGDR